MWMSKKASQYFIYMFILWAVPLILCAVVSVETLSYHVAVLMVSNGLLCYNSGVDMAAVLRVCCKEEHCAVIGLLWSDGVPEPEIHPRLSTQYGNIALPKYSVYKWTDIFKNGSTSAMTGVTLDFHYWWEQWTGLCQDSESQKSDYWWSGKTSADKLWLHPWNHSTRFT